MRKQLRLHCSVGSFDDVRMAFAGLRAAAQANLPCRPRGEGRCNRGEDRQLQLRPRGAEGGGGNDGHVDES